MVSDIRKASFVAAGTALQLGEIVRSSYSITVGIWIDEIRFNSDSPLSWTLYDIIVQCIIHRRNTNTTWLYIITDRGIIPFLEKLRLLHLRCR